MKLIKLVYSKKWDRQTNKQTNIQTNKQTDKDRQKEKTDKDRQKEKTDKDRCRQKNQTRKTNKPELCSNLFFGREAMYIPKQGDKQPNRQAEKDKQTKTDLDIKNRQDTKTDKQA